MAITSGFFNSVSGDRTYNAEQMNTFLEGLVSASGVYANVDDGLQVAAGSGLTVNIGAGKGCIDHHWFRNSAIEARTLDAADVTLNRYDAIVLRYSVSNRAVSLGIIKGANATTPTKPALTRNQSEYDICLAYIYVGKGATTITQANIQDTRGDSSLCGYITGLVQQLDTEQFYAQLDTWMTEQQAAFTAWFNDLTEQLNIDTYIQSYWINHATVATQQNYNLPSEYAAGDIVEVYLNNIVLIPSLDYTISGTQVALTTTVRDGNAIHIRILKSVIGYGAHAIPFNADNITVVGDELDINV